MRTLLPAKAENHVPLHVDNDLATWQMWCRLCAKEDPEGNVSVFFKGEQQVRATTDNLTAGSENANDDINLSLVTAIEKYFWIQINCDEKFPKMLCTECFSLITSLVNFTDRVAKVQQMFLTLQNSPDCSKTDIHDIRLKYGLLDEDREHVLVPKPLPEVHYLEAIQKINIAEEYTPHEGAMVNPLEQSHIKIRIKKEQSSEDTPLVEDKHINCDEDELPFDNDEHTFDNLDQSFVDELMITTKGTSGLSDSEQMSAGSKSGPKRKLRNLKGQTIKDAPKKRNRRKRRQSSSDEMNDDRDKNESTTESGDETLPCTECPRKFKRIQDLGCHMTRTHSKKLPDLEVPCTQCSRVFKSQYKLKKHLTTHLPEEERKTLPCRYCEKKFSAKFLLQIHVKHVHMDERPFVCEKCGVAVRTSAALKEHMLTHTDYAPFKCEVCEKHFKDKFRLKKHMGIHGPAKHTCAECGLQLNSRDTLNRHLLVHSDKMQHKCDYCGREFKRAKALKTHLILHTGLKPYSCNFCDRTFANGSNCRSHKKKAHPEELAALEASGGGKTYTRNIPKLEALKAITKAADNLAPVVSKQSGCFAFGKKPKPPPADTKMIADTTKSSKTKFSETEVASNTTNTVNLLYQFLPPFP